MMKPAASSSRVRRSALRVGCLAVFLVGVAGARAAAPIVLDDGASPLRCLVVPATALQYPSGGAERKEGGVFRVRLTFESAQDGPRVEVLYSSIAGEYRAAVIDRVERYRLPCLAPGGAAVVATQEFEFIPGDGRKVVTRPPRDDAQKSARLFGCLTGMERPPDYPQWSSLSLRSGNSQGTVIASFEFVAPDRPPRVEILFDGGNERFARTVRDHIAGYRAPCLAPVDFPLKGTQPFQFRLEGEPVNIFKDVSLATFVRGIDRLESEQVRFDFTTMGCPFDVRFTLWKPYTNNGVGELERSDPNRREFIEWLRRVDLKVPANVRPTVTGQSMTISVPCGVLDLL